VKDYCKNLTYLSINSSSSITAGVSSRSKDALDTIELERAIDELVYKLYQLTPEEIKIIENRR